MENNKGFSLIELIVTVAVLAVVCVGVGMMLSGGTSMFSSISKSEATTSDLQIAMSQVENYVIDCSALYYVNSTQIQVGDKGGNTFYQIYKYSNKTTNCYDLRFVKYVYNESKKDFKSVDSGSVCTDIDDLAFSKKITTENPVLTIKLTLDGQLETRVVTLRNATIYTDITEFGAALREGA